MFETIDVRKSWGYRVCTALLAVFACVSLVLPQSAFADVRKADIVGDSTVDELGLTVSQCPNVDAEHAVLMDEDGNVYFQRDAQGDANIASVTKVMTAIVACENADANTVVTVSAAAAAIGESSAGLQEGDSMDFDTALKALLVPSGNDAAVALAETVGAQMIQKDPSLGSNPVDVFVKAMNDKANELGCTNTVYENPHGLDYDEYAGNLHSCAADQALVGRCAMSIPKIRSIVGGGSTTIVVSRDGAATQIELETTDLLLDMYDRAIGIKTGLTEKAGECFSGAATDGNLELYAVVLNSDSETQRFLDAKNLFEWGYSHIIDYKLANSTETATMQVDGAEREVPVIAKAVLSDWTDKTVDATLSDPDATVRIFNLNGNVSQSVQLDEMSGSVHAGDKVGTITFKQHNNVIATMDLVACEDVEAPGLWERLKIGWTRLTAGMTGAQTVADPAILNTMTIVNDKTSSAA